MHVFVCTSILFVFMRDCVVVNVLCCLFIRVLLCVLFCVFMFIILLILLFRCWFDVYSL